MYLERVEKRKDVIWGKGRIEYNGETTTGLGLFEIISMDRESENGGGKRARAARSCSVGLAGQSNETQVLRGRTQ